MDAARQHLAGAVRPDLRELALKAAPTDQLRLLDLQSLDTRLDQLAHRRKTLPEHAEIARLDSDLTRVRDLLIAAETEQSDVEREQAKADADVEQVRARRKRDRDRMDQGLVSNPKDLERMQHELETLERRIATLEDEELEVMQQLEDAQAELDRLVHEAREAEQRLAELVEVRDQKSAEIDRELEELADRRSGTVDGLPDDLLALYEKLRDGKGGVGAAELRARQCGGCRLTLDAAEVAEIRATAPEQVVRCEECQRILVRTAESGL